MASGTVGIFKEGDKLEKIKFIEKYCTGIYMVETFISYSDSESYPLHNKKKSQLH